MININEELKIVDVLKSGFQLFTETIKNVIPIVLISSIINGFISYQFNPSVSGIDQNTQPLAFWSKFWPYYIVMMVVGIVVNVIVVRYLNKSVKEDQEMKFDDLILLFSLKDFKLIITYIIWGLLIGLSMLALIIPGIYTLFVFIMGLILAVIEKKYFWSGVKEAFRLVKKRWWKTFILNLILLIPLLLITMLPLFVINGYTFNNMQTYSLEYIVLTSLVGLVVYPFYSSVLVVHYHSLKIKNIDGNISTNGENTNISQ